jgi:hypothetical protein
MELKKKKKKKESWWPNSKRTNKIPRNVNMRHGAWEPAIHDQMYLYWLGWQMTLQLSWQPFHWKTKKKEKKREQRIIQYSSMRSSHDPPPPNFS